MYVEIFQPGNLATFLLTFLAGLLIAKLVKARGIGGCFVYVVALAVVVILVTALWTGYSYFIERITYNLENYLSYNAIGLIGALTGFVLGLFLFNRK